MRTNRRCIALFLTAFTLLAGCHAAADSTVGISASRCKQTTGAPTSFRTENYRSPTPACTPYGTTVNTQELRNLLQTTPQMALIDVLGVMRRPEMDEFDSAWLPSQIRHNLPGSHWLPNVGYAQLDDEMKTYLFVQLQQITNNDPDFPIVMYCIVDCWLSWNALKRAHDMGYRNLYWYPDGTDGWADYELPLVESTPIPIYPDER